MMNMNKKLFLILLNVLFCCAVNVHAQDTQKSELQLRAEAVDPRKQPNTARSLYIQAFKDYCNKGQLQQGAQCVATATALYYKENLYKEAFDLLYQADQEIIATKQPAKAKAAAHYVLTKERLQMYIKLKKSESAKAQLNALEVIATRAADESINNDLLYTKAIYYYTFGMNTQGNAVFKEMADKLTASKDYDKVDEVYQTLIASGRKSGNANMVAQSYSNYLAWKDSTNALKHADEIKALKQQIADNEASIADKDSSLTTRWVIIIGLAVLAAALAAALAIGAIILMRFIMLTRKQKKTIQLANDSNALKAKFISNMSAQLRPTLEKLDSNLPEVKALLDFANHSQTLSELENSKDEEVEMSDTPIQPFCEKLIEEIRPLIKSGVTLTVNTPKLNAPINKEYVWHILLHLLTNAAEYTPENGKITLDYKKRGQHTHQFLVSDTGDGIPAEKRDDIFKPFTEIHDLTKGDGLGLPICKQMALKMKGDLDIDTAYVKGTRFVLELHA